MNFRDMWNLTLTSLLSDKDNIAEEIASFNGNFSSGAENKGRDWKAWQIASTEAVKKLHVWEIYQERMMSVAAFGS